MIEYIEQTSSKKLPVIIGKNVRLIPFFDILDMERFVYLHRKDRRGYMCRFCLNNLDEEKSEEYISTLIDGGDLYIWNVESIHHENKRVGFIYLTSVSEGHSVSINGIMDNKIIRDILSKGRKEHLNFSEEAIKLLMKKCFDSGFERIEGDCIEDDREAIALHKRIGFIREGLLRKAVNVNGEFKNLIIASMLKDDFKEDVINGKK